MNVLVAFLVAILVGFCSLRSLPGSTSYETVRPTSRFTGSGIDPTVLSVIVRSDVTSK